MAQIIISIIYLITFIIYFFVARSIIKINKKLDEKEKKYDY